MSSLFDEASVRQQADLDGVTHFATGIAVFREGKLLVVRRAPDDDFLSGQWELPGGGVDEGEKIERAACRELLEETGLKVSSMTSLFAGFDYTTPSKPRVRQINFRVQVEASDIKLSDEHDRHRWITEPEIESLRTNPTMEKCLHDAFA